MTDGATETTLNRSFRFEWGGVQFEVHGSDGVVREGFKLLESEILPRIDSTEIPEPAKPSSKQDKEVAEEPASEAPTPKEFMADKDPNTTYEKATALSYYATKHRGMDVITGEQLDKLITEAQLDDFKASDALYNAERNKGYMENTGGGKFKLTQSGVRYVQNELSAE